MIRTIVRLAVVALAAALPLPAAAAVVEPKPNTPIKHFVMLMQENHSFDNYFADYPGANGRDPNTCMPVNLDKPKSGCVNPEHLGGRAVLDLGHTQEVHEAQFNNGKMDGFVSAFTQAGIEGSKPMGFYDDRDLPYYWNIADNYVLFDNFFSSAHGGSVWNHMFWVTGAPGNVERDGKNLKDGETLKDGYTDLPQEGFGDLPTIFDRLEEKGISWKFYVQNYDPTNTWRTPAEGDRKAQSVWVPLLAYSRYLDDPKLFGKIQDMSEFYKDLQNGTLPSVAYIAPAGSSEHPPGRLQAGQTFVRTIVNELQRSSSWDDSAFFWTYDDWGGWYDHVPPRRVDSYGYGFRVPALLVSPYARKGEVNHTETDFTSALKFIEENWSLEPLAERDRKANGLMSAFDFSQAPRAPVFLTTERVVIPPVPVNTFVVYWAYGAALVLPLLIVLIGMAQAIYSRRKGLIEPEVVPE